MSVLLAVVAAGPLHSAEPPATRAGAATVRTRLDQAKALYDRRDYTRTLEALRSLLPLAEAAGDDAVLGRALFYAGRSHYFLSDYRTALPLLERSLTISRQRKDRTLEAEALRGIGRLYKQRGLYPESLTACEQAIRIYDALGNDYETAVTWITIGASRDLMGEYPAALGAYEKARGVLQKVRDVEYYTLLNEIGITYTNLGRYEDALSSHQASLEGRQRLGDDYLQGVSHSNIGDVYFSLGQYERAVSHYEQCITLCARDGRAVAVAYGELARAWMAIGDHRRALDYAQRELQATKTLGTPHLEGVALGHIAQAYAELGDFEQSLRHHAQARELLRRAGALADEGSTLAAMAAIHIERGRTQEAQPLAERALALAEQTHAPDLNWQARVSLARAARARGDSATALSHLRASVEIIDSLRGRVLTDSGKIGYLDARQDVFHELVDTLHDRGRPEEALEAAEAARGRAFVDLLAARQPALRPTQAALLGAIREAEARLRARESAQPEDEVATAMLASTRAAAQTELVSKLHALRNEEPELASLVAAEPLEFREISAIAARLGATLVEYFVTEKRLLIWVIHPTGEIHSAAVDVGRDVLRQRVRALHTRLNNVDAKELRDPAGVRRQLAELYRWMLAPIEAQLPRQPDALVYVAPHDALLLVPFAALVDGQGRYVAHTHTLASAPSLGVLRYTAGKKQWIVSPTRPHLLALADPAPPEDAAQEALPGAREEVRRIGRRFPKDRRVMLIGEQATEANLKRLSPGQTLLHLAVHGLARDDRPLDSALILSAGEGEDGWLTAREIFGLELRADLVVLSGCSTGLGKLSGDGVVGLARALIHAGAPSVIVSQWDVSDLSTAYMMDRFYAELAAGRGKARALRTAQLAALERFRHPALWAAFTLIGEPQ